MKKDAAVHAQEFENAANLRDRNNLKSNMKKLKMNGRMHKMACQLHCQKKILLKLLQDGQVSH
ncbi:hypothetical protein ACVQ90_02745 [Staphylococcus aureus]